MSSMSKGVAIHLLANESPLNRAFASDDDGATGPLSAACVMATSTSLSDLTHQLYHDWITVTFYVDTLYISLTIEVLLIADIKILIAYIHTATLDTPSACDVNISTYQRDSCAQSLFYPSTLRRLDQYPVGDGYHVEHDSRRLDTKKYTAVIPTFSPSQGYLNFEIAIENSDSGDSLVPSMSQPKRFTI